MYHTSQGYIPCVELPVILKERTIYDKEMSTKYNKVCVK